MTPLCSNKVTLIARISEGSVRDAISLLDRALISQSISKDNSIEETDVREMLGLADRSKIISLFKEVLSGNEKESLKYLDYLFRFFMKSLIENFFSPIIFVYNF